MRTLAAYKVDAFTTTPYTGNIAGVVPDADGLTQRQMQAIAREMNVSETAFVLPPTAPGATLRLRYFTPTSEIRLCGHATIATFHLLVEKGRLKAPAKVALETNVGVLDVDLRTNGEVYLTSDPFVHSPSPFDRAAIARLLGLDVEEVKEGASVVNRILFAPVTGLKAMEAIRPDLAGIKGAYTQIDGLAPVSLETSAPDVLTRIRDFVPALGIDEDPVTGVAHMGLAGWLLRQGTITSPAVFVGEQGFECGRPGRVRVEVEGPADAPTVRIGGRAVTVLEGTMRIPV